MNTKKYIENINFLHLGLGFLFFKFLTLVAFMSFALLIGLTSEETLSYLLIPSDLFSFFIFGFIFSRFKKELPFFHGFIIGLMHTLYFLFSQPDLIWINLINFVLFPIFLYLGIKLSKRMKDVVIS